MKKEIKVPAMGESISEATIGQILKKNGSNVAIDDEILELETDKVNQILYAPEAGIINFTVKPGDRVKIGQIIGSVDSEGEAKPAIAIPKETQGVVEPKKGNNSMEGGARKGKEAFISSLKSEKSIPREGGPALQERESSTTLMPEPKKENLKKPLADKERPESRRRMTKIRQVIAERLVEAQRTTAMLTTFNEVDMTAVIALRTKYKEQFQKEHNAKIGFMSFFCKAVLQALQVYPDINSYIDGDEIVHREYYNIGIAVSTDRGLVVPVIRNCDQLSFAEIELQIEHYAKQAREGSLSLDDLRGGGFTITNGGVYGSLLSTPILNPPQSGILGMHKIEKRAVVIDDQIVIRPMMYLALSYDHRIVDGKEAVSFLINVKECLEDPARMLLGV